MSSLTSERRIVFLVGAVQFINILDFMMVSPLGRDFSEGLHFPASSIGLVVGAYTAAAFVSGLAGALFLDRFDRRSALAVCMAGLIAGTAAGGLARGLHTLMAARIIAGAFGGPATSIAMAMIADAIPAERRGRALGAVAGAFSAASVLGVPAGLWLAAHGGWQMPFFAVAGLGVLVAAAAVTLLPAFRGHLAVTRERAPFSALFRPTVLLSWTMTATLMIGTFAMVPNLATYYLGNLRYPRADFSTLYLVGGMLSFFATRLVGKLVDRYGSFRVATLGTLWLLGVLYTGFVSPGVPPGVPSLAMALFLAFMISNSLRGVPLNALTSKVPAPAERARFMSIQSAVQHLASSAGAILSASLLTELPDGGGLDGLPRVTIFSMALAATFPVLSWVVETRVTPRAQPAIEAEPAS